MARTTVILGAAALLALGGVAAIPDEEPRYLGDMPSSLEQPVAERPPAPRPDPGPAAGGPPPALRAPSPVAPEVPAAEAAPVPAGRVPAPAADTVRDVQAGTAAGDAAGAPLPGLPRLFADVIDTLAEVTDCVVDGILTLPDGGLLDCVTGLLLPTEPPVDPTDPLDPVLEPVTP
ncbi:hypothetical protein [Blastococcus tunisiensis]|uniref:Uncharacterized protein n=1 Tax=Blastococcus tunisiensis TaxID=1798228 RepID=A0A1I2II57_9ACTN|nr:hypothetical protein [Blastococcus sp. DSM 46838]SFF42019.1 hypothetical protein SAMN05216574_11380 [Blastococcus sp. DSM 46838]